MISSFDIGVRPLISVNDKRIFFRSSFFAFDAGEYVCLSVRLFARD